LSNIERFAGPWPVGEADHTFFCATSDQKRANLAHSFLALLSACLFLSGCIKVTYAVNPTAAAMDNADAATSALQLTNPATDSEIEGYASAVSLNRGENIKLYVSTKEPTYTIEILRVGWYGGRGMKSMIAPISRRGLAQAPPVMDSASGLIECDWQDPYVLSVPESDDPAVWPSGIYVAKLTTGLTGKQSYVVFVVRDDRRPSDLLFQQSVTTYQAYNDWGGRSLYTKPRASKVSFNRPYLSGHGTGHLLYWELSMVQFLEKQGYDVTYTTDVDTHEHGNLLALHKGFLSVGHDEYWSWQMRDNVEAARDNGVNLAFFGSNVGYWQIRLDPSSITGDADRTIICYKNQSSDPVSHSDDLSTRRLTTVKFRSHPVDRPEDALVGVMYETDPVQGDIVVSDASSWLFEGTGLKNGDHLPGLLGYEVDRMSDHTPTGTRQLAHSPYPFRGNTRYSDMILYTAPSGGIVFATGSMQWNWGLADPGIEGRKFENSAVKMATGNLLRRFGARSHVSPIDTTP
jgi:hypothetical protein